MPARLPRRSQKHGPKKSPIAGFLSGWNHSLLLEVLRSCLRRRRAEGSLWSRQSRHVLLETPGAFRTEALWCLADLARTGSKLAQMMRRLRVSAQRLRRGLGCEVGSDALDMLFLRPRRSLRALRACGQPRLQRSSWTWTLRGTLRRHPSRYQSRGLCSGF